MDIYSLRMFLHLSNSLHFARTSQACFISPSGLSRLIQRLEEELGDKLFERNNRSVSLTNAGMILKEYAQEIVRIWEGLKDTLAGQSGELHGEIKLYCSVTASYSILRDKLSTFRKYYPKVHITLETGEAAHAIQSVQSGDSDISIAAQPKNLPRDLKFKPITVTPLVFIAPSIECDVTSQMQKVPVDWGSIPMILPEHGLSRSRIEQWFHKKALKPLIYAEVAGNEAIIAMVSLGCGVGIVPELVIEKSTLQSDIKVVDVKPKLEPYYVGFCVRRRKKQTAVIKAFWDLL